MKRHSIRWRLPLSYATIAFITALTLGAVLFTLLREYYAKQEREYMAGPATAASEVVGRAWANHMGIRGIVAQLRSVAFFPHLRIQFLDTEGNVLADTGESEDYFIVTYDGSTPNNYPEAAPTPDGGSSESSATGTEGSGTAFSVNQLPETPNTFEIGSTTLVARQGIIEFISAPDAMTFRVIPISPGAHIIQSVSETGILYMPVARTSHGFSVGERVDPQERSQEEVVVDSRDANGTLVGYVKVSGGPAIGNDVLRDVRRGWLYAGGAAVLLAALAGWIISHRLTVPLLSLTETTAQMATGDLSARATIQRRDELGRLAVSFNTMAARIENTVTALQQFVADAAHELHTPLTVIRANLELIGEKHRDIDTQRALEQTQRLHMLADNLLLLSRIEAKSSTAPQQPVDLNKMVQDVSAVYASQAEQADINFVLELSPVLPSIQGNPEQLQQALNNLLDNAVKFTLPGGTITVNLRRSARGLMLTVQDTGIGIPEEDLPFVFNRFRRGRNTANYPGSGLGLAIVKAIVDAHHGVITAENCSPGVKMTVVFPSAT